jgi:hypothetical protein
MIFKIIFLKERHGIGLRTHRLSPWILVHGSIRLIKRWASVDASMV